MILQAVPTEEPEDSDGEDVVLGTGARSLQRFADAEEATNWRLIAVGICCSIGVVGVGASLALLSRYASETEAAANLAAERAQPRTMIAVLSFGGASSGVASPTSTAVAWIIATLLKGGASNLTQALGGSTSNTGGVTADAIGTSGQIHGLFVPEPPPKGPFIPGKSEFKSWWPVQDSSGATLEALAHGRVAQVLRDDYGIDGSNVHILGSATTPEADVFLLIRSLSQFAKQSDAAGESASKSPLVIASHPHHMPYLAVLAKAAGLDAMVLNPAMFEAVPWAAFGCNSMGYARDASPTSILDGEVRRLDAFASQVRLSDPQQAIALLPTLQAANATLRYHLCVAKALQDSSTWHSGLCRPAN
eukprot:TRINITY_DN70681_c0_g1_i1.p1 TRINITY_DN70681_c0_g1~~TRINITY_DN70681_c0_g1_i1.p1  ORF type:complete len:362 (-),score=59.58 TRINITY_DN70681_c0_g1_i1:123-1208(-)